MLVSDSWHALIALRMHQWGLGAVSAKPAAATYVKEAAPSSQGYPAPCFPLPKSHQGQISPRTSTL